VSPTPSLEDGKRPSFQNIAFLRITDKNPVILSNVGSMNSAWNFSFKICLLVSIFFLLKNVLIL
jgi:hypothetical protein